MKATIVILVLWFAFAVESAEHKKHKTAMKASNSEDNIEWPQPDVIRNFAVPPEFTASPPIDEVDDITTPSSGKHHGKSNRKSHSN